jgi:hypothetical protein
MHGIYNSTPETDRVSRLCSVASVSYLQFLPHVMLCRPWNMFICFVLVH